MINLWIIFSVIFMLACLVFVWSLCSGRSITATNEPNSVTLNKALYSQRLVEIDSDSRQGKSHRLAMIKELKLALLGDVEPVLNNSALIKNSVNRFSLYCISGLALLMVISFGLYSLLGNYKQHAHWQSVMDRMPELTDIMVVQHGKNATEQDINDFILGVRTRLMSQPGNIRGWDTLGRIGLATRNYQLALDSYQQALTIAPDNTEMKLSLATVLLQTSNDKLILEAQRLIGQILELEPDNLDALSAAAFAALQQAQYEQAILHWQQMLQLPTLGDERRVMIEQRIRYAQQFSPLSSQ